MPFISIGVGCKYTEALLLRDTFLLIRSMHNVSGYGILLDSGHGDAYTVCAMKLQVISSNVVIFTLAGCSATILLPSESNDFFFLIIGLFVIKQHGSNEML